MGKYLIGLVAVAILMVASAADDDPVRVEMRKLEGTWQLITAFKDGKATSEDIVQKIRLRIKKGKQSVSFGNQVLVKEIPFRIDPTRTPKTTVEQYLDGKEIKGIYKLERNFLISCVADVDQECPTDFEASAGSGYTLRVFRRVKP